MPETGAARTWVLAFVLLAGGGLATLIGVGCVVSANACPFRSVPEQKSTDGRTLFATNCAACHGRDGSGRNGPSLVSGRLASAEGADLESKIARGKPLAGMPRFSRTLSQQQIEATARYVESLRSPSSPSPSPAGGSP